MSIDELVFNAIADGQVTFNMICKRVQRDMPLVRGAVNRLLYREMIIRTGRNSYRVPADE